ncbi:MULTISPECIES: hypothetical protein [Stenotrophomonas]|nr:hypothetical protein [Stenotrophomonas maltophilia]EJP78963.1 hypothetical protein A1OC_03608 [Stenotrophomonas maltophilia Ab55555]EKT2107757.1 hypothetical protein [Stenotrophomonas maltophilia]EKU9963091.1 hypothetical protein [Stenotrophomonas maltophilia]EKZ1928078.1 hypothetical protein [Stenotrophomonas maltophilia]ELE7123437.1 hypothetical protein [Stenotrophomonas maltophilia]
MYRWVRGIISYRTFYIWRARFRYYTRNLDLWTLMSGLCIAGLLLVLWYLWQMLGVPPPRVHPQAAALRIDGVTSEAIHRIVLVRHAGSTPGAPFTTPEEVRASTLRTMRVRQVMDSEVVWRLKADMLADIADYITATGGCFPYNCRRVLDRLDYVRQAGVENAQINAALSTVLEVPLDQMPPLEADEHERVKSGWSDGFDDIYYQSWLLRDLQVMHAQMMREYPQRAPAPWLPRLFSDPLRDTRFVW